MRGTSGGMLMLNAFAGITGVAASPPRSWRPWACCWAARR